MISTAHMLHDIYSSFFVPLLPLLKDKLGLSNSLIGILSIIQRLPSLLNPFIGILADKFPVRFFIILAPALTSITMSFLGLASNIFILAVLLFVTGISSALFHTPSPVMIKQFSGKSSGKGMSFYMLGGELARTLGPLIITGAVTIWGLEGTWKLLPFGLLASFILFLMFRKIPISKHIKKTTGYSGVIKTLKKLSPFFITLSGFILFRGIAKAALTTFITIYLDDKGGSLWFVNGSLAVLQFAGAAGVMFSGIFSDKIGRTRTLLIISILTPILMGLFIIAEGVFLLIVLILLGFVILSTGPVMLSFVNRFKSDHPALINGVFMTVSFIVGAIAILITGFMGDILGLEMTFKIATWLSLGSIPFVLMLSRWDTN